MSLRSRILGAFILIILLAVSLSVGVGYVTVQRQLDTFISELSRIEANSLAQELSQAYTSADGWDTLDVALFEAGYLYEEGPEHGEGGESGRNADGRARVCRQTL